MVPKSLSSRSVLAFGQRKRYPQVKFAWPWNADFNFVDLMIAQILDLDGLLVLSLADRDFSYVQCGKSHESTQPKFDLGLDLKVPEDQDREGRQNQVNKCGIC